MPKLYIANVTQQIHQFTYWLPEGSRSLVQEIPIGGQLLVSGRDLPVNAIEGIIQKKVRYGLVPVAEALSRGHVVFHGLAYQLDHPIDEGKLYALKEKYDSILNHRGQQLRQEAAIASNQFLEDRLFEAAAAANRAPPRVDVMEMHVEEISQRTQENNTPEINERVQVRRDAPDPRTPIRRRPSSRRR